MLEDAKILKYINYFSSKQIEFCKWIKPDQQEDGVIVMGYPRYDEGVKEFVNDFYKSDFVDGGYIEKLEKYRANCISPAELIEEADIDLLKAILTYYVRQERFCDGAWADAIEEKMFLRILTRLRKLKMS